MDTILDEADVTNPEAEALMLKASAILKELEELQTELAYELWNIYQH